MSRSPFLIQQRSLRRGFGVAALLIVWQLAGSHRAVAYYISTPAAVASRIGAWMHDGTIWPHLASTIETTLLGFALAAITGTVAGLAVGSHALADRVLRPLLFVAYSTPKIVLAPVLVLWIGIGKPPAIVLAFLTGFFMVFFNVHSGTRAVSRAHLDLAAILGASPWSTLLKFRLPAAAPYIALGLQQGLIYAFHGAIIGEMTASNLGVGYLVIFAATGMDATALIAALCLIGACSFVLISVLGTLLSRSAAAAPPAREAMAT